MNKYPTKLSPQDFFESFAKVEPFQVLGTPMGMQYVVSVDEVFESVKQFENIVHILENASQGDTMEIKLSSDGGALHAILPLLAAMESTPANVFIHAVSDCSSAATFLLMAADDVYVNPYVTTMFHTVRYGAFGQGHNVESQVLHTTRSSKALIEDFYSDFFTPVEIAGILSGTEVYLSKEEFDERYNERTAIRKERAEAFVEAFEQLEAKKATKGKKKVKKEIVEEF